MKFSTPLSLSILLSLLINLLTPPQEDLSLTAKGQRSASNVKEGLRAGSRGVGQKNQKNQAFSPFINDIREETTGFQGATVWLLPGVTATKSFIQVGNLGTAGPTPGDTLEYTVVISNTAGGATDATGVTFTDQVDANTTLVPGSVKSGPIAVNDSYSTVGNVSISVPAASGLMTNDVNLNGTPMTVTGLNTTGTKGDVTFNANGSFTFNPSPGFTGSTTFKYAADNGFAIDTGTVNITVTGCIWFINASSAAGGDGRLNTPFNTMNAFNASSLDEAGDNIFVYTGTYTNTLSTILLGQQKLIGQGAVGASLAALAGVTFSTHPPISPATIPTVNGTRPTINQAANNVNMQSQNQVRGVNINNTGGTALLGNNFTSALVREVSISNTGGVGVNFNNGALDVIIQSITASNSTNAISVTTTTGSFEVTGTGTTDASGGTLTNISGRGIELRNATNITLRNMSLPSANSSSDAGFDTQCDEDDVNACYAAIYMNVVNTAAFHNIDIGATKEHGIMGLSVSTLTMDNCTAVNNGDASSEDENALKFRNLSGTCSITNSTFQTSAVRIFHLINNTGSLNLTVNNCTFNDPAGADCFEARTQGSATATINLTNSLFQRATTKGIQAIAEGGTMNININNCKVQRFGTPMAGIEVGSVGTATINYNIVNCTDIESSQEVAVLSSTYNTSVLNGRLNNNTNIGYSAAAATVFANIRMLQEINSTAKYEIRNNANITIANGQETVVGIARIGTSGGGGRLDFIVDDNTITRDAGSTEGIELRMGGTGAANDEYNIICNDILNNSVIGPSGTRSIRVRDLDPTSGDLRLQGDDGPNVPTYWTDRGNTHSSGMTQTETGTPAYFVSTATCSTPTHATASTIMEPPVQIAQINKDLVDQPGSIAKEAANLSGVQKEVVAPENLPKNDEAARVAAPEVSLSGETVTVGSGGGFLMPAGKSMTIKFRVTINSSLPAGVCQISNQGTVSGSNFSSVLTDDVSVVGASNPTVTSLSKHNLGNLVFRDVNKNGVYNSGTDTGIDGVLVKLYNDNGTTAGTRDAGDTYITETTTSGGGIYAFTNLCSGEYIVEIASTEFASGKPLFGLISSPTGTATDPDDNIDNDDNGQDALGGAIASQAITLQYNGSAVEQNTSLDFGFKSPTLVSIGDVTLAEGTGGSTTSFNFIVTRDDASEAFNLTVNTADGTAVSPSDFTAITGGTVSFTAGGSLTQNVTVLVNHDNVVEAGETFTVLLSGAPAGVTLTDATGQGTITNDDAATVTLTGGIAQNEGNSGTTSYTFTATLNAAVQGGFSVAYTTNDGTATTADTDYADNDGSLSFTGTAGETKTITVLVNGDTKVEANETFTVALGAITGVPSGVTAAGSPQTGTITNDDAAVVSIAANVSQSEATTPQAFSVTLSNPVDVAVTVQFSTSDGTATIADNDYTGITNQVVTFAAGTTTAQTVNVAVTNDTKVEADEVLNVSIGSLSASGRNVSLGTAARTGTITNDDAATVTLSVEGGSPLQHPEGNSGTTAYVFTATLTNAVPGGFSVAYTTSDGTGTVADNDYTDNDGSLSFTGTAGETQTITVLVKGDLKVEVNETFIVALGAITGAPSGVTVAGSGLQGVIVNDELDFGDAPAGYGTLLANDGARHNTSPAFHLGATVDGDLDGQPTATGNGDDIDAEGNDDDGVTLPTSFITGTTANITVNASGAGFLNAWMDFNNDGDWNDTGEQIFVNTALVSGDNPLTIAVPANATAALTFARFRYTTTTVGEPSVVGLQTTGEVEDYQINILNTQYSINSPTISEGNAGTTNLTFTITRSNNANAGSVNYAITGGTAQTGSDYQTFTSGTATFTAGGALTQSVTVVVNGDLTVEANETVVMTLSSPVGGGIGTGTGTGTINNDDAATVTLTGGIAQNEGNSGTTSYIFTATLSAAVQGGFSVAYTTSDGTATVADNDYTDNDNSLSFTGTVGETKTITVLVNGDTKVEANEAFTVALGAISSAPTGVTVGGTSQTGTITNDDAATVTLTGGIAQNEGNSGTTSYIFTATLNAAVQGDFSVAYTTSDGTAMVADNDYTDNDNSLSFTGTVGETKTITVLVSGDTKVEANETFTVALGAVSGTTLGASITTSGSPQTGTITNDDAATLTLTGGISQNEGNTGTTSYTFTATLNAAVQGGFTIPYTTNDGTATVADNDYTDNDASLSFTGTSGETKTITVLVNGDHKVEAEETFTVALGTITGTTLTASITKEGSPQTGTITNDELDFGDAPTAAQSGFASSYPTLIANSGGNHATIAGIYLGSTIDGEDDGQPTATANGEGSDDDGVTLPASLITGTTAGITINASVAGYINAWIDYNRDGDWDDEGEKIFNAQSVTAGSNSLSIAVPAGASVGTSFARFRFTTSGESISYSGKAIDGEVEDYQVSILNTQFSVNSPSIAEGNSGTKLLKFVVSRNQNGNASSVDYAVAGLTATSGSDFQPVASGTLSFPAGGALTDTVRVTVNGDVVVEDNETLTVSLSNSVGGGISTAQGTGTITNDDAATLTLAGGVAHNEGLSGTVSYSFTATLSAPVQGGFTIPYTTNDGTATVADNDYTDNDGTLTFAGTSGEVKTITVLVNGDNKVELNETFTVALGVITGLTPVQLAATTVTGSPQTGTITNDDAATVAIAGNVSQSEGTTPQTFSVTLSNPVDVEVTVKFSTSDGTATAADNDYTAITNQLVTFPAGTTTAQSVNVIIANDTKVEAGEVFNVGLSDLLASSRNVTLGTATATGTITNNDAATLTLTGTVAKAEGNSGTTAYTFTATLSAAIQGGFSVAYTTNDGTATVADNDYTDNDGTLTFTGTAGEEKTITVLVTGDQKVEANETFTVALGAFSGTTLEASLSKIGSPQTGTINNDEIDFGDAPDPTYPTLLASNGARHSAVVGLYLGNAIDGDNNGQPTATANGDDTDAEGDDDDGVTFPTHLLTGTNATITVTASAVGKLDAWIDFNRDGDWADAGEQIATSLSMTAGANQITFAVPVGSPDGNAPARFRFSTAGGLAVTGLAADGEVEDHLAPIINTLRIFVNVANVNPTQNGMTWATAFSSLQAGLSAAAGSSLPDIEVWVAQGTYKPGTLRKDVFEIPTNIRVYGGFDGTENDLSQRNWKTKVTTLSGEIGTSAITDNSQHVVLFRATNAATRLDGFTIEKGYAEFFAGNSNTDVSAPALITSGGGILAINKSKGAIVNCTVTGNKATAGGGIMVRDTSDMVISKTVVWGNEATFGGGVYVLDGSKPRFENVLIVQNKGLGGGIYVNRSQPEMINSTIASNFGTNGTAGGIFNTNSVTTVKNGIVWGNSSPQTTAGSVITYSIVEGGSAGTGNTGLNPLFVNPTPNGLALVGPLGDYHLQACSPAINAGDNTGAPAEDLDGAVRPYAVGLAIVDMGAYESQSAGGSGPAELTVTEPITSGTVLKTAGKITATNQVSGATVTYQAGQSVTLLPGFTATGSTFQAVIGNCPN